MAQSGHPDMLNQCPLSGVKRTSTKGCYQTRFMTTESLMFIKCTVELATTRNDAALLAVIRRLPRIEIRTVANPAASEPAIVIEK
jgi:hypothetical protein